jgi:hypothetical protein
MARIFYAKVESGQRLVATDITDLTFFPKGTILMFSSEAWSETTAAFKTIWKICNGQGGTPNLVNKFLRGGANSDFTNGGGADNQSVTLSLNNLPSHKHRHTHDTHTGSGEGFHGGQSDASGVISFQSTSKSFNAVSWMYGPGKMVINAPHSYDETPAGGGQPFTVNTLPAYYTVIYIMKMA